MGGKYNCDFCSNRNAKIQKCGFKSVNARKVIKVMLCQECIQKNKAHIVI